MLSMQTVAACGTKPRAWLRSIAKGGDDVRTMDDATFERLRDEWRALMRRFARMGHESPYARAGISPLGTEVLIAIGALERAGEVARPSVVAKRVGTTPSSLSQALKSLEEKGLLERRRLAGDSRGVALALTEAGRGLARCGLGGRDARLRALFDHLGAEDVAEFMRIARTMQEFYRASADVLASDAPSARGVAPAGGAALEPGEALPQDDATSPAIERAADVTAAAPFCSAAWKERKEREERGKPCA